MLVLQDNSCVSSITVWSKTFLTIKNKTTPFIFYTPSRQMDPRAHSTTIQCTKEFFIFADFLLPRGHDVAVVSTEDVLSIAVLWGGFIWNFPRMCADVVFSFLWKASVLQEADWSYLSPHLGGELPALPSARGIFLAGNLFIIGKYPKYPLFLFPFHPGMWVDMSRC